MNKFKNVKRHGFDSKLEERRYAVLKAAEEQRIISDLQRQTPFLLIPKQKGKYRNERAVEYKADFTYWKNGDFVVEDTKSEYTRKLPAYVIKRKLMLWHGYSIKEVTKDDLYEV